MFFLTNMPSTASVFSAYTAFTASTMVVRTMVNEIQTVTRQIIPQILQDKISAKFNAVFGKLSSHRMIIVIDENNGITINEIYRAAEIYLATRISPSIKQLKASMAPNETSLSFNMSKGENLVDVYEGIEINWELVSIEKENTYFDFENSAQTTETVERKHYRMSFDKKSRELVMKMYLPYVVERSKAIEEENKKVKLHALFGSYGNGDSIVLEHTCSFETLAMDHKRKRELIEDLDRFVKRKDYYRRLGKAWKRGYLLYGPPGTGKSSLIAAMANYLKFSIYDLELSSVHNNSALRTMLLSTANRSIIVIEDIDCSTKLKDREDGGFEDGNNSQLTLSGVLNVIDGLWSSCGDAKIIIFTTNHKDKLDPALLRPGRMDMHIHMSYLTHSGFQILASNYLQIDGHYRFKQIEEMLMEIEVTPAEIAEELMKSDDPDVALEAVVEFLNDKKKLKIEKESNSEVVEVNDNVEEQCQDVKGGIESGKGKKKNKRRRAGRGRRNY